MHMHLLQINFGDDTPRMQGRLNLNPTANISGTCTNKITSITDGTTEYYLERQDICKIITQYTYASNCKQFVCGTSDTCYVTNGDTYNHINYGYLDSNTSADTKYHETSLGYKLSSFTAPNAIKIGNSISYRIDHCELTKVITSTNTSYNISSKPYGYRVVLPTASDYSSIKYSVSGNMTISETSAINGGIIYVVPGCTIKFTAIDGEGNKIIKITDVT